MERFAFAMRTLREFAAPNPNPFRSGWVTEKLPVVWKLSE